MAKRKKQMTDDGYMMEKKHKMDGGMMMSEKKWRR